MPYQPDQTADAAGTEPNDAETPLSPGGDLLVIDTPGAVLGKHSERLQVRIDRMLVQEAPLFRLRQVVVASRGVQVSSDVIRVCARRGISLHVLGRWPGDMATVSMPIGNQTVATRRAQFRAADNGLGDTWVRRVVEAKLRSWEVRAPRALPRRGRCPVVQMRMVTTPTPGPNSRQGPTPRAPMKTSRRRP